MKRNKYRKEAGTKKVEWKGKKQVTRGYNTVADGWAGAYKERKKERGSSSVILVAIAEYD